MLMGSVRVRAGPGCSSAWARLRLRRQVKQQSASALSSSGIAIWPASVHRRGKKRGIAHQSLFSRACLRGRTDWLPTPDGGRCLKSTVLSAGRWSGVEDVVASVLPHLEQAPGSLEREPRTWQTEATVPLPVSARVGLRSIHLAGLVHCACS